VWPLGRDGWNLGDLPGWCCWRQAEGFDALSVELLAVVDQAMQPTQASLWLRPVAATRPSR
jgi:hypothetical protein